MKKSIKVLSIILMILLVLSLCGPVNAHNVELDPDSVIRLPSMIWNGEGTITIDSEEPEGYTLYFQSVEMTDEEFEQIENVRDEGNVELDNIKEEVDALSSEVENLRTIYETALANYNELVESGAEEDEQEAARLAYETARENYSAKVDEYNLKVDEYNNKVTEINNQINSLIPMYDENAWIETADGNFKIDLASFSGRKTHAIWARLDRADGTTSYDVNIYTTEGDAAESIPVTSVELNRDEISIPQGSTYNLVATVNPTDATNKELVWSSSNEEVATVENGRVTGVSVGTATITVRTADGGFEDTCLVTVSNSISIDTPDDNNNNDDNNDNNNNGNTNEDDTTAPGTLPQTGTSYVIAGIVISLAIISIVLYKKIKYNNFK